MTERRWELIRGVASVILILSWAGVATYHYLGDGLLTAVLLGLLSPLALSIFASELGYQRNRKRLRWLFTVPLRCPTRPSQGSARDIVNDIAQALTSWVEQSQGPSVGLESVYGPFGKALFPVMTAYLADLLVEGRDVFIPVAIFLFLVQVWLDSRRQYNDARSVELTLASILKSSEWPNATPLVESLSRATGFIRRTQGWFMRFNPILGTAFLLVYGSLLGGFAPSQFAGLVYAVVSGVLLLTVTTCMILVDLQSDAAAQLTTMLQADGDN